MSSLGVCAADGVTLRKVLHMFAYANTDAWEKVGTCPQFLII